MLLDDWGKEIAGGGAIILIFLKRLFTSRLEREIKSAIESLREIDEKNATQLDDITKFIHRAEARFEFLGNQLELIDKRLERLEDRS